MLDLRAHRRRSVGGSLYFLKWSGRPLLCSPYFFVGRHFVLMQALVIIHWMFTAFFVKFSQLGRPT